MTQSSFSQRNQWHFVHFFIGSLLIMAVLSSCDDKTSVAKIDLKKYYFPYKNLDNPKMYAFNAVQEGTEAPEYWVIRSFLYNGDTLIERKIYDFNLSLIQKSVEKVISNGVVLKSSVVFEKDSSETRSTPMTIKSDDLFAFEVDGPQDMWISNTHWDAPFEEGSSYTFIKNKHFGGYKDFEVNGQNEKGVSILANNLIENINDGSLEIMYNSEEIYVKNVGLAYFRKEFAENSVREYKLAKIYNKEEFQKWFP